MSHTPTPWRLERHSPTSQYFGNLIGSYGNDTGIERIRTITCQLKYGPRTEQEANAEFIVKAVNNFEPMLEALKMLTDGFDPTSDDPVQVAFYSKCKHALDVIAKAESAQ